MPAWLVAASRTCARTAVPRERALNARRRPTAGAQGHDRRVDRRRGDGRAASSTRCATATCSSRAGSSALRGAGSRTTASTTSRASRTRSRRASTSSASRSRARASASTTPVVIPMSKFFGKYRGKVENNVDPLQQGRVQVSVPAVLGDGRSRWAMPCAPFARLERGLLRRAAGRRQRLGRVRGRATPTTRSGAGCFWGIGEVPASPGDRRR